MTSRLVLLRRLVFVSMLFLAGLGTWALLSSKASRAEAPSPESEGDERLEAVQTPAVLVPPVESEVRRAPLAAPEAPIRESKSVVPAKKEEMWLEGRFVGFPTEALGKRVILTVRGEAERLGLIEFFDLKLEPKWRVRLTARFNGTHSIQALVIEDPYFCSRLLEVQLPRSPSKAPVVVQLFPRAGINGRVWDESGHPIAVASVTLSSVYNSSSEADENGEFSVLGDVEGVHTLTITADGYFDLEREFELQTSERRFEEFVLRRPMRVAGVIRWPFGAPAENVSLFLRSRATGETSDTDSEGRFDFTGGPAMKFVLYARFGGDSGQDFSGRFELDPAERDLGRLDLVLQRSPTVSGTLLDDEGLAVPDVNVELTATDNPRVTRSALTRADGTFTVRGLYPGSYRVTCELLNIDLAEVEVESGRSEPFLEITLPPDPKLDEVR